MEPLSPTSAPTFFVIRALKRHWRLISVFVIAAMALTGAYAVLSSPSYTSSATVQVRPLVGNAFSPDTTANSSVALATEAEIVTSADVVDRVRRSASQCNPSPVTASVLTNALLIKVSYDAQRSATARTCAEAFAQSYLDYRNALALATQSTQINNLTKAANKALSLLKQAQADAQSKDGSIDHVAAAADAQKYTSQYAALQTQIAQLESLSTAPGSFIVHATRPRSPNGVSPLLIVLAAALVGLLLGALFAVWRSRRDRRIMTEARPSELDLPVLATVLTNKDEPTGAPVPDAMSDEDFRIAGLSVVATAPPHRAIAVSPMSEHESSAAVAIRLARGIAAAGYTVVLVDAVTDAMQIGDVLDVEPQRGLSDIVEGAEFETVSLFEYDGLEVMTAGTDPSRNRERRSGMRIRELLDTLKIAADYVLVSTASITTADGLGVLLGADHLVLVAHDHSTTYENVAEVKALARRFSVEVLGLVVARIGRAKATTADRSVQQRRGESSSTNPNGEDDDPNSQPGPGADTPEPESAPSADDPADREPHPAKSRGADVFDSTRTAPSARRNEAGVTTDAPRFRGLSGYRTAWRDL